MQSYYKIFWFIVTFSFTLNTATNPYIGFVLEFKDDSYNENIKLLGQLGSGSNGEVWKGIEKSRGRVLAIKFEKGKRKVYTILVLL